MSSTTSSLSKKQLKSIFSNYDLGEVCSFLPKVHGQKNTNYFVTVSKNKPVKKNSAPSETDDFVLTLLENDHQLNSFLKPLLKSCTKAGLPVPRLCPTKTGALESSFNNQTIFICSRIRGQHVFNPTLAQCASIGRFLARFHLANAAHEASPQNFHAEQLLQQAEKVRAHMPPADANLLHDSISGVRSMLARSDLHNLPKGLIHGGLSRDGVLFNERGLSGVQDFHRAENSFWMLDLAVAVNDWCVVGNGALNINQARVLIGAYHQIRSLTKEEFWYFPLFLLFAAVNSWLEHLNSLICSEKTTAFRNIVARHVSRPFHLQVRQL